MIIGPCPENNRRDAKNAEKPGGALCALCVSAVAFIRCGAPSSSGFALVNRRPGHNLPTLFIDRNDTHSAKRAGMHIRQMNRHEPGSLSGRKHGVGLPSQQLVADMIQ
jgi:hypothetical protein